MTCQMHLRRKEPSHPVHRLLPLAGLSAGALLSAIVASSDYPFRGTSIYFGT
jgi:hypothetical protein